MSLALSEILKAGFVVWISIVRAILFRTTKIFFGLVHF